MAEFAQANKQRRAPWPLLRCEAMNGNDLRGFVAKRWRGSRGVLRRAMGDGGAPAMLVEWNGESGRYTVHSYPARSWWQGARHTTLGEEVTEKSLLVRVNALCQRIEFGMSRAQNLPVVLMNGATNVN